MYGRGRIPPSHLQNANVTSRNACVIRLSGSTLDARALGFEGNLPPQLDILIPN
jgi:hypothetical protein